LKILFCATEAEPFAKTGGLGDVVGALPPELKALGHDVRVVIPFHGSIDRNKYATKVVVEQLGIPLGFGEEWCAVHATTFPGTDVPVYLIEHEKFFARQSLYQYDGRDYDDNAARFAFFSRACCQLCKALQFAPDVMHCHDWQTGLVPVYLRTREADHPLLWSTATVLTIHNVGYQGVFFKDEIVHSQLGWQLFTADGLEFHDRLNYLKGGILYSDKISTVSPNHAREIQTPADGWGLDGVLRARAADLVGILNGCDYRHWDPGTDKLLPRNFDSQHLAGKTHCREELQKVFDLDLNPKVPIVALVTRMAYQKGVDVLAAALPAILDLDLQFVVLGEGEIWAHFHYGELPARYPGKAGVYIGYDNRRAHLAYAGADFFLMPSRYEPCGISQLISKRYGTLPIVRSTGGLDDTVANYDETTGEGDGFKFFDLTPEAIANTVGWAVSTYYDRPQHMKLMIERAMRQRFLWSEAAVKYEQLYFWALEHKRGY
jgi:starch synthase